VPFVGCRGLVSEMQKAEIRHASSTTSIANQQLHLEAELTKQPGSQGKGFNLKGRITVTSASGDFPKEILITRFSLKPSWKGWPGYYVINFANYNDTWELVSAYDEDVIFTGTSKTENGQFIIEFTWRNQGWGLGSKPQHFVAYDVAVTVKGPDKKFYLLSQLDVPVK
jgi:hypothetical protein